jgi:hypothetical protein
MIKLVVPVILCAFLLSACSVPSNGTDDILKVVITPNLAPFKQEIHQCASDLPGHVFLVELPYNTLKFKDYAATIHAGQPPVNAAFSTQVGSIRLVFIINPDNPISQLDTAELASILLGIETDWQALFPSGFDAPNTIQVWSYPEGDDVRGLVEELLLNGRSMTATNWLAPDGQAMVEAVLGDPSAIGFIAEGTPHTGVSEVQIEPMNTINMTQPILASLPSTPEGAVKDLLTCLSQTGE